MNKTQKKDSIPQLHTIPEVARWLGISERALAKITVPYGPLKYVRIRRCKRFNSEDVRAYIKSQTQGGVA